MARRNTYKEDEVLETPFDFHHLLRAFVYIKKYAGSTGFIQLTFYCEIDRISTVHLSQ